MSLSECRTTAHRVWPTDHAVIPHAVVISEVSPNGAAGKRVLLRSNVTIVNTLQCDVLLLLQRVHATHVSAEDTCCILLHGGAKFNVPLHLSVSARLSARPAPRHLTASAAGAVRLGGDADGRTQQSHRLMTSVEICRLVPPMPSIHDATLQDLSQPDDDNAVDPVKRALLCLRRQASTIQHPVWGTVPDVVISVLPKFTLENRLPVALGYQLLGVARKPTTSSYYASYAASYVTPARVPVPPTKSRATTVVMPTGAGQPLPVGERVVLRGTGRWHQEQTYLAQVIDHSRTDDTVKVRFDDGGYKRYGREQFLSLLVERGNTGARLRLAGCVESCLQVLPASLSKTDACACLRRVVGTPAEQPAAEVAEEDEPADAATTGECGTGAGTVSSPATAPPVPGPPGASDGSVNGPSVISRLDLSRLADSAGIDSRNYCDLSSKETGRKDLGTEGGEGEGEGEGAADEENLDDAEQENLDGGEASADDNGFLSGQLRIGEHFELTHAMAIDGRDVQLKLRYDDNLDCSDMVARSGASEIVQRLRPPSGRGDRCSSVSSIYSHADVDEAPTDEDAWEHKGRSIPLATYEAEVRGEIGSRRGRGPRHRYLFTLGERMQVWVQLTGGGANRPLRVVIYCDLAIMNKTTLSLEYTDEKGNRLLPPPPSTSRSTADKAAAAANAAAAAAAATAGSTGESATAHLSTALSLLCPRSVPADKPNKFVQKLRLCVRGMYYDVTTNHRIEAHSREAASAPSRAASGDNGEGIGMRDAVPEEAEQGPSLRLYEPHEQKVLETLVNESSSPPLSLESATEYGEISFGNEYNKAYLGVSTRLQTQESVPSTTIVTVTPRFMLVNRLKCPIQFFCASNACAAHQPAELTDVVRAHGLGQQHNARPAGRRDGGATTVSDAAHRRERDADTAPALEDLLAVPPGVVSPVYAAMRSRGDGKERSPLFIRTVCVGGRWSPPLALDEESSTHFFGQEWADETSKRPTIIRVSVSERAATIFITVEDATDTPPCCITNSSEHPINFCVRFGDSRSRWLTLRPQVSVPVLWSKAAATAARQRTLEQMAVGVAKGDFEALNFLGPQRAHAALQVLLCTTDPEADANAPPPVTFDFAELYRVVPLQHRQGRHDAAEQFVRVGMVRYQPAELTHGAVAPSAFGSPCRAEAPSTRAALAGQARVWRFHTRTSHLVGTAARRGEPPCGFAELASHSSHSRRDRGSLPSEQMVVTAQTRGRCPP